MEINTMNGNKIKHSKFKNTGLIFEFLVRQITADILDGKKKDFALMLVKKSFNENTELGRELKLYSTLVNEYFRSDKKADYLISEVLTRRNKLNNSKLRRERYNLIKSIKENCDVDSFFASKVSNYKIYASIYRLFEYNSKNYLSPEQKTESYFNILEHITTNHKTKNSNTQLQNITEKISKDTDMRILTYKILLEKFNKKYTNLDQRQKDILKHYINNISNTNSLKEYVEKEIPKIKTDLKKYSKNVTDKVVKIKLKEAINSIDKFCGAGNSKIIKDSIIVQLMRYNDLLHELKNYEK